MKISKLLVVYTQFVLAFIAAPVSPDGEIIPNNYNGRGEKGAPSNSGSSGEHAPSGNLNGKGGDGTNYNIDVKDGNGSVSPHISSGIKGGDKTKKIPFKSSAIKPIIKKTDPAHKLSHLEKVLNHPDEHLGEIYGTIAAIFT